MYRLYELAAADRVVIVRDRHLDVDGYAAEGVDDLLETVEVDLDVVRDVDLVELAQGAFERGEAALPALAAGKEVGLPAGPRPETVDLGGVGAAVEAVGAPISGQGHVDGVTRQAQHRHLLSDRIDAGDDHRVGVVGRLARAPVDAEQQDVEALLAVPGRCHRFGGRLPGLGRRRALVLGRDGAQGVGRLVRGQGVRRIGVFVIAAAADGGHQVVGDEVVASHGDVGDRGHQDDCHEAGHRERVPADARSTEARGLARSGHRVRGRGQAEGVDDGDHAIGEEQKVDDEDRRAASSGWTPQPADRDASRG